MSKSARYVRHRVGSSSAGYLSILARRKAYLSICIYWLLRERLTESVTNECTVYFEELSVLYGCRKGKITQSLAALSELITDFKLNYSETKLHFLEAKSLESLSSRENKGQLAVQKKDKKALVTKPKSELIKLTELEVLWNRYCGALPQVKRSSKRRKATIRARLKEVSDLDYWVATFIRVSESRFCNGENDRGWRADFDFVLKPDSHLKINEGKYDGVKKRAFDEYEEFLRQ